MTPARAPKGEGEPAGGAPGRLAALRAAPPAADRAAAVERHRRLVARLKIALPAAAALVVAAVFAFLVLNDLGDPGAPGDAPAIEIKAPRLSGVDEAGRPFAVRAAGATQGADGAIGVSDVEAEMTLEDGVRLAATATSGRLDPARETVELSGGVDARLDGGYRFRTEAARIDLKAARMSGELKVRWTGRWDGSRRPDSPSRRRRAR